MSDSFLDVRAKPLVQQSYLRSDWIEAEQKFSENFSAFLSGIAFANVPSVEPKYIFSTEVEAPKGVEKKAEKILEKNTGIIQKTVESVHVTEVVTATNIATNATKELKSVVPATKELSVVSVSKSNDLDDIFGDIPAGPKTSNIEDDFFSVSTKASASPAVKADDAEAFVVPPKKVAPPEEPEIDIFGESSKVPEKQVSEPTPEVTTEQDILQTTECDNKSSGNSCAEISCPPIDMSYGPEAMEGFDPLVFDKVNRAAHEMLHWLPNDDIGFFRDQIPEYSVEINLEHLRGKANVLADKLMEIQSKRDALYTATIRWQPVFTAARQAEKYVLSAGMIATEAKSADKRAAQIRAAIPTFWKRHSDILAMESTVSRIHEHLCNWYECLSRLISSMQITNKIGDIARGEVPFDGPYTTVAPTVKTIPKCDLPDTPEVNSEMSQPISVPKFSGCQSFANVGKPTGSKKFSAGENDW